LKKNILYVIAVKPVLINDPMTNGMTNVLIKIFANGFYRVHAGLFLFFGLVMVGAIPPQNLWMYEKTLMLAFITGPIMMLVVFTGWLIYTIKAAHYVTTQIYAVNQQFLFYSSNSFSREKQFKSWFYVQFVILLPLIAYGLIAVVVAIDTHYFLASAAILFYLLLITAAGASLYVKLVNRLMDGSKQSVLLRLSSKWNKPFFSLFIYHAFDKMKVTYLITKALSWLIIIGVFGMFADVKSDIRVAGIAMLAIITAHAILVYQQHVFEGQYLSFSRNLPHSYLKRFADYTKGYLLLLLPETIWLFCRFDPFTAVELLLMGLSVVLFLHCLIYKLGQDMDKYLQWVMGTFILLFWVIMFRLIWLLIPLNIGVAYLIFYKKYYSPSPNPSPL
jgi:hypothetical protein